MRLRSFFLGATLAAAFAGSFGVACSDSAQVHGSPSGPGGSGGSSSALCPENPERTAENLLGIGRLGLALSRAIIEGTLSDAITDENAQLFVRLHVDIVWFGPAFLEGFDMLVPVDEAELATFELPGRYVLGFGGNSFPLLHDTLKEPVWWHPMALFPAADREAYGPLVGYHSSPTPFIGVVRISSQDANRTHFELIEPIQGTLPASFADNWTTSLFPVPFPAPSGDTYIAGMSDISYNATAGEYLGSIMDFRPATPENRALVDAELAAPVVYWDRNATQEEAIWYQRGWAYSLSPHVMRTRVSGSAEECCTNAGGTYIAQHIEEFLRGTSSRAHVVTGGHGYDGPEACGDAFLLGVRGMEDAAELDLSSFACDGSGVFSQFPLPDMPDYQVRSIEDTAENRKRVDRWLSAAPPAYRLFPESEAPSPQPTSLDALTAPWSVPVSVEQAIVAGTYPSVFRIESVKPLEGENAHEIVLSTTFSLYWYEHLPVHRVKIACGCADPRLLQTGAEWIGFVLFDASTYLYDGSPVDYTRAFLIPGVLLPSQDHIERVLGMPLP